MDGVIVIRKEKGFTSHDVVAKLRGILHMKKIGHTGTLDPDAALLQKLTMVTVLTELCWAVLWDSLPMICASEILLILLMKKV